MKTIKIQDHEFDFRIEDMRKRGLSFYIKMGSRTKYIVQPDIVKYVTSENFLPNEALSLIRSVKSSARNCKHPNTGITPSTVQYSNTFFPAIEQRRKNVVEVDINQAYWDAALRLGFISKKVYRKAEETEKKYRLMALGSLASSYDVYVVKKGGEPKYLYKQEDKRLKSYFFSCCLEIDLLMREIYRELQQYCYAYWVDAVFVEKSLVPAAQSIISDFGYGSKVKELGCFHTVRHKNEWRIYATEKTGRVKYFCI